MRWHARILRAVIALTLLTAGDRVQAGAPPSAGGASESILVLLTGEVIQGSVSEVDDKYLVALPTGRVFVPMNTVEVVCRSLSEAYEFRRSRIGRGQAQEHAELAQWCERHGLDHAAREQLEIARQLDPDHPIVGLVERRLTAARSASKDAGGSTSESAAAEPTPQQLADFAAGLPHGTVEAFTRVVQPLLINRCATAGCHSDRSDNEFRLERSRPGTPLGQTSTHRNLLATLKLIDSTMPDECELLRPKRCPHRLTTAANLSLSKTSQYRFLVAWVRLLAQHSPGTSKDAEISQGRPATIRSGPPAKSIMPVGTASPADYVSHQLRPTERKEVEDTVLPMKHEQSSADPFDPDIFNHRYGTSPPIEPTPKGGEKVPAPSPFFPG